MSVILKLQADEYRKQYMGNREKKQHVPLVLHACKQLLCREKFPLQNSQADMTCNHVLPSLPFGINTPKQKQAQCYSSAQRVCLMHWMGRTVFAHLDMNLFSILKMSKFRMSPCSLVWDSVKLQWITKPCFCSGHVNLELISAYNLQRNLAFPTSRPTSPGFLAIYATAALHKGMIKDSQVRQHFPMSS